MKMYENHEKVRLLVSFSSKAKIEHDKAELREAFFFEKSSEFILDMDLGGIMMSDPPK